MKSKIILLLFATCLLIFSCDNKEMKSMREEMVILKKKNDSLNFIIEEISEKYVFDSISIVNKPSLDNTYKIGSNYKMNITISAFNKSDYFIKYDTVVNNKKINADTLEFKKGTYEYNNILDKDGKYIRIEMLTGDKKYGQYKQGILTDKIRVKK